MNSRPGVTANMPREENSWSIQASQNMLILAQRIPLDENKISYHQEEGQEN